MDNGVSLRDYFEALHADLIRLLDERKNSVDAKFHGVEAAARLAQADLERRLDGMNEFRSQLTAQAGTFVRQEMMAAVYERIGKLEKVEARMVGYILGAAALSGIMSGVMTFFFSVFWTGNPPK